MNIIPYGKQQITEEDIQEVVRALKGDLLTMGPAVTQFESDFCNYIKCAHAVAVANGTAALHLAALALNVRPGERWLTTPLTFAASGNCILYCGGEIDFCDIDPTTLNLDLNLVEQKLKTGKYQGVIAVNFAGFPMNLEELFSICEKHGVKIIEDCAHSPGGYFIGKNGSKFYCGDGSFADLATFSFHPVKHLTTGEGGMVTTSDENLAEKIRLIRNHGITRKPEEMHENHGPWYMEMQNLGYNYRISDILCALGSSQIKKAALNLERRRSIANIYNQSLENLPVQLIIPPENVGHAYHLYLIQTEQRLELFNFLRQNRIFAQVHYIPLHTMPYYRKLGFRIGQFPISERVYNRLISLPMYHGLLEMEQMYVIERLNSFYS